MTGARWTRDERSTLDAMLAEGRPYHEIAEAVGRSFQGVASQCHLSGIRQRTTTSNLSGTQVMRLFGLTAKATLNRWIARGWLTPTSARFYRFPIEQMHALIANGDTWMAWDAAKISDPDLRAWALDLRREGPRWLTTREAAQRLHVVERTVWEWIQRGYLPAVRYGIHWVRDDQFVGFVPPCARNQ
jgi:excisionase family DNA binding protein